MTLCIQYHQTLTQHMIDKWPKYNAGGQPFLHKLSETLHSSKLPEYAL